MSPDFPHIEGCIELYVQQREHNPQEVAIARALGTVLPWNIDDLAVQACMYQKSLTETGSPMVLR
jgi:hypothetical protein